MGQSERQSIHSINIHPAAKIQKGDKVGIDVFNNKTCMGTHLNDHRNISQQLGSGKEFVHHIGGSYFRNVIKRLNAMAESKVVYYIMNIAGGGTYLYAFFLNLGDVKGFILFLIAVAYAILRLYFTWDKQRDESKMRKLKLEEREFELHEKIGDEEDDISQINN